MTNQGNVESLADRIRAIANIADRPGLYDMLHDIADELDPPTPENVEEPT
jgi:hypothetical protein